MQTNSMLNMKVIIITILILAAILTIAGCHRPDKMVQPGKLVSCSSGNTDAGGRADSDATSSVKAVRSNALGRDGGILPINDLEQQRKHNGNNSIGSGNSDGSVSVCYDAQATRTINIVVNIRHSFDRTNSIAPNSGQSIYPAETAKTDQPQNRLITLRNWLTVFSIIATSSWVILFFVYQNNKKFFAKLYNRAEKVIGVYAGVDGRFDKADVLRLIKDILTGKIR